MIYELCILPIMGFLDRVRGGYPDGRPKWIAHVATSASYAMMLSLLTSNWYIIAAGILFGEVAWRQDNGWRGNWVRKQDHNIVQPIRWGLIWCAPTVLVAYWEPSVMYLWSAAPIGATLAIVISTFLPATEKLDLRHAWPWSELIELPLIGVTLLVIKTILEHLS